MYVAVTNLAETIAAARRLGGSLVKEPTDVGDETSFALVHDPSGVLIGLWARGSVDH